MTRCFVVRHRIAKTSAGSSARSAINAPAASAGRPAERPISTARPSSSLRTEYRTVNSRSLIVCVCIVVSSVCVSWFLRDFRNPHAHVDRADGRRGEAAGDEQQACAGSSWRDRWNRGLLRPAAVERDAASVQALADAGKVNEWLALRLVAGQG